MFNPDNPLMRALGKLADLVILNFLTIICSIPIFTIGASITACYYCTVKITKDEESYIWKDFFKSFKLNFRQSTVIWLINLILISIYGADFLILTGGSIVDISTGIRVFILLTGVILFLSFLLILRILFAHQYYLIPPPHLLTWRISSSIQDCINISVPIPQVIHK